jgi:uncharacterized protein (AIM24 family)
VNLGLVFLKAGVAADAVRCFETALDLQPQHAKAQNYLGLSLAQTGEYERARDCFVRCGNAPMAEKMAQAIARAKAHDTPSEPPKPVDAAPSVPPPAQSAPPLAQAEQAEAPREAEQPPPEEKAILGALKTNSRMSKRSEALAAARQSRQTPPDAPGAPSRLRPRGEPTGEKHDTNPDHPAEVVQAALRMAEEAAAAAEAGEQAPASLETTDEHARPLPVEQNIVSALASEHGLLAPAAVEPPHAAQAHPQPDMPSDLAAYTKSHGLAFPAGESGFSIGQTEIVVHVHGEMLARLDGLVASWGSLNIKPELKRFRGKATDKPFGEGARRMLRASGQGRFVISREGRRFTALELGDEPAYFREETLFAFEESLLFENGRVPSRAGTDLHLVHLRGHGRLLLCTLGQPRSAEVVRGEPLRIPMDQLVGWHGPNIQPRLVPICEEAPELGVALELAGEGRALVDAPDEPR